ncbi:sulfurtransferase [Sphingobacterium sp. 1.A.4]|uniref:sulfurtransferase n=1 Tax=Sphingobacterium sp. 1.A.4 TaxID=2044603 RepID=UPI0015D48C99|nr:rhodanese-like domain-containing protein [Sphingobacterium sp. 1.A.4]
MEKMDRRESPLISTDVALQMINDDQVVLLDATIDKVNEKMDRDRLELIPGSLFFDIEGSFSDHGSVYPHTMVDAAIFEREARKLGINQGDKVIVYDRWGIYSSPRAWWMFKLMGVEEVYVLRGGLPAWKAAGLPIVDAYREVAGLEGDFVAREDKDWMIGTEDLMERLGKDGQMIVDARSEGRFHGTSPEPRAGLKSGHIPGSKNIPFDRVLDGIDYKVDEELSRIFEGKLVSDGNLGLEGKLGLEGTMVSEEKLMSENVLDDDSKPIGNKPIGNRNIFTCGSGVSAAILALAAYHLGSRNVAVYDGSWSEWGAREDTQIER